MLSSRSIWRDTRVRHGRGRGVMHARSFGTEVPQDDPREKSRVLELEVAGADHAAGLNVSLRISRLTGLQRLQKIAGWELNGREEEARHG